MGAYEEMLTIMRKQAVLNGGKGIQLAEMTGANTLKIGDMLLNAEDLMFNDLLIHPPDGKSALKTGDIVAVMRYSDTLYLVMEKMVNV